MIQCGIRCVFDGEWAGRDSSFVESIRGTAQALDEHSIRSTSVTRRRSRCTPSHRELGSPLGGRCHTTRSLAGSRQHPKQTKTDTERSLVMAAWDRSQLFGIPNRTRRQKRPPRVNLPIHAQ